MVFKRRDKRPFYMRIVEAVWPKGGWARAFYYVTHRLKRLPDPPEKIARGIFAGVFTTFTPYYGLHFLTAFLIARLMRGNVLAALLATFFGNPLTYVPIAMASLSTGHFLLGRPIYDGVEIERGLFGKFLDASNDLKHNIAAIFTPEKADWSNLIVFYNEVFFPYLIGGLIPGTIAGIISYYLSAPLIRAYQNRRKGALKEKLLKLKKKPKSPTDDTSNLH